MTLPETTEREYFEKIKEIADQFLNHSAPEKLDSDEMILDIEEICQKYWNVEKV